MENLLRDSTKIFREENLELELSISGVTEPIVGKINKYEWDLKITGNLDFNYIKNLEVHFNLDQSGKDYYTIKDYRPKTADYNFEKQNTINDIKIGLGAAPTGPSLNIESGIPYSKKGIRETDSYTFKHQGVEWNYFNIILNPSIALHGEAQIEFAPEAIGKIFKINMIVIPTFCRKFLKIFKRSCIKNPRINLSFFAHDCIDIKPHDSGDYVENKPRLIIAQSDSEEHKEIIGYLINKFKYPYELKNINKKSKFKEIISSGKENDVLVIILKGKDISLMED